MSTEDDEQGLPARREVERFLKEFKLQMEHFDVVFRHRDKNRDALLELDIPPNRRKEVLQVLSVQDYSEGPLENPEMPDRPLWVFGKSFLGKELYIKINLGRRNRSAVCVSFHIAEHQMDHPFKG